MVAILTYTVSDISNICEGKLFSENEQIISQVLTDSRKYKNEQQALFVAIKGTHHDGHEFIEELYKQGLRSFLIDSNVEIDSFPEASFVLVKDSLSALQSLAAHHRKQFDYPLIAITGSNGKTIVKEWLFHILFGHKNIVRSPKSYNSQLGVPLSVLNMSEENELAIFEAGISQPNEMEKLQLILKPDIAVFTNLGSAHDIGFSNREEKLKEKLRLSDGAKILIAFAENADSAEAIHRHHLAKDIQLWSFDELTDYPNAVSIFKDSEKVSFSFNDEKLSFRLPFTDDASVENIINALLVALYLKIDKEDIQEAINALEPVAMRLEMKAGQNNSTLINDSYNADLEGVQSAIDFLIAQTKNEKYTVIISDLMQNSSDSEVYKNILDYAEQKHIDRLICIGNEWKQSNLSSKKLELAYYKDSHAFIKKFNEIDFTDEAILIKGARKFQLEKVSALLERDQHKTVLEVNLSAFIHNLSYYRNLLESDTKIMVMVKAFSYGSGTYEIPKLLEYQKVDYLAVAYTDEGVDLRRAGIETPIMVMNPQAHEFSRLSEYNLEPEIYSMEILGEWLTFIKNRESVPAIHLKVNTGMNRLGFSLEDIDLLVDIIKANTFKIASIFSHLAASDDFSKSKFTLEQINKFTIVASKLEEAIGKTVLKHILNSAGIENHLDHQFDMVRLGIGLYGIGVDELESISTFKTYISQIRTIAKGEIIGYGANNPLESEKKIAIINAGYSDGLDRRLSNGVGEVLINGHRSPIIGKVCMDMTMIDITELDSVKLGDEVMLFGSELSISEMAENIGTIPYEILTGISQRIPRIYFKE